MGRATNTTTTKYIDGVPINTETISNAYRSYYTNSYNASIKNIKFLQLFGIRVTTCDTSKPDDIMGGIRSSIGYTALNSLESVVFSASVDPSPLWLAKPFDAEAKSKGGTAWLKEGQHSFYYISPRGTKASWSNGRTLCSFCPQKPVPAYRWTPNAYDIQLWRTNKKPLSEKFRDDLILSQSRKFVNTPVKLSNSTDVCIHKSWGKQLYNDSAGCQIVDVDELKNFGTVCKWASEHIGKGYANSIIYTLFTKEEFLLANSNRQGLFETFKKYF